MESFDAIAQLVTQKDNKHSDKKIAAIEEFMTHARFTKEGSLQRENEINFYESRKELNKMIIASGNQELIRANVIKILHRMIFKIEIPSCKKTEDMEAYRKIIEEYLRYLGILSVQDKNLNNR